MNHHEGSMGLWEGRAPAGHASSPQLPPTGIAKGFRSRETQAQAKRLPAQVQPHSQLRAARCLTQGTVAVGSGGTAGRSRPAWTKRTYCPNPQEPGHGAALA